ncbi:MAG: cytochrome c biogenesis protein CcsA [Planctomycetes bacterium]|nr:cytochrome c biogenesis protein CcsA [Planctomycetota bacterium]
MLNQLTITNRWYWGATMVSLLAALAMTVWFAPLESSMGPIQKIFYLHLPAAINTFIAAFVVFAAGIRYLWTRDSRWDLLAESAARVVVLYCAVVLVTGMIWAHVAWGRWWTWSPRLTFSLIMLLLYVVYLAMRPAIESARRREVVSAVYGLLAFLDVPLVYLSVKLLPDIHPSSVELEPAMQATLAVWFVPISLLCVGLIAARYQLGAHGQSHAHLDHEHAPAAGFVGAGGGGRT